MTYLHPIFLDATPVFGTDPIALYPTLGRPWLSTFLDMVSDADALDRLTVLTAPGSGQEIQDVISSHHGTENVQVVTTVLDLLDPLIVNINEVYARHLFIRMLRSGEGDMSDASTGTLDAPEDMKIAEEMTIRETGGNRTGLVHYFYRPLARLLVNIIAPTGITPNAITLISLSLVPVMATFIALDNYWLGVAAAGLLQLFFLLDVMDGVLARKTKRFSNFGYWFDTMVDTIHDSALAVAFTAGAIAATGNIWLVIPGGIWLVSMSATWSNGLIATAAGVEGKQGYTRPVGKTSRRKFGPKTPLRLIKYTSWALGKPEIILILFGVGLVLDSEWAVVLFFATLHGYNLLRMMQLAYAKYRRNELSPADSD